MDERPAPAPENLPPAIRRYAERAVPADAPTPTRVRVTQEGRMRLKPDGRWMRFSAVEDFQVRRVGFSWRARFPLAPFAWLSVVDEYEAGAGRLEARMWGRFPFMRASGEATARAQAQRYLSELFWVPHAISANLDLEWRETGDGAVEVATTVGPARVTFVFELDTDGDIVGGWAPARPRAVGKTTVGTPWRATVGDYATVGGIRLPRRAEVAWELSDGPFRYFEGRITGLQVS